MDGWKKNPVFVAILLASVAASIAQGWIIGTTRVRVRLATIALATKRDERDGLAHRAPAPSEANARAIAADVAAAENRLAGLRASLAGGAWLPPAPARSIDGYFAFMAFTDELRALAAREQVELRAEERFGFSAYANEGPEADRLDTVHRQRVVVQHVLETLFAAHPRALLAVRRERPQDAAPRAARFAAATDSAARSAVPPDASAAADYFEPDSRLRLGAPGLADGELYRVEFAGQTPALRAFLNALAASPLPLFVRAVEVEPIADGPVAAGASVGTAPVPLVAQNLSKFSVVLECVEIAPSSSAPAS